MSQHGSLNPAPTHGAPNPVHLHGLIRKLAVLACAIALPLALAASAQADTVSTTMEPVDETFADPVSCGGEPTLLVHQVGSRIQIKRYNDEGELISWVLEARRTWTVTNPANGKTATGPEALIAVFDPSKAPAMVPLSHSGLRFALTAPGYGVLVLDAGRLEFGEGGIEFVAGEHQLTFGELEAACAYFADP